MQNRNEKKGKYSGVMYATSGALIGAHYWNEFCYIPYRRELDYYNHRSRPPFKCLYNYFKLQSAHARMIKGSAIIPISAAAFYLVGKSFSFFEKSKRENEVAKLASDKITDRKNSIS